MTARAVTPYANSWDHLVAEIGYVELLVREEADRFRRAVRPDQREILRGVFISDEEVGELLASMSGADLENLSDSESRQAAAALEAEITERRQASLDQGVYLSLPRLADIFGLTRFEERLVLLCLAPEIDARYEKLYAYLQDDVTRRQPGIDLALRLLCSTRKERMEAMTCFSAASPLFRARILRHPEGDDHSLKARSLRLDEQMANYLIDSGAVSREVASCCRPLIAPAGYLQSLRWPDPLKQRLAAITRDHLRLSGSEPRRLVYHFYGPAGTGKKTLAAALCAEIGVPLLVLDLREVAARAQDFEDTLRRLLREGLLRPAAIYLEHFELLRGEDPRLLSQQQSVARAIGDMSWLTFIATERRWEPAGLFTDHVFLSIDLPAPDLNERARLWPVLAAGLVNTAREIDWGEIGARFRLTPGQMRNALIAARNRSLLRADGALNEAEPVSLEDLYAGCRSQSNQKLSELARKLGARRDWTDITLPDHSLAQLREICEQVRHRQTVYGCWGFSQKQSGGKGLCVLFHGLSGTGKTLAAEVIGNELRLDVYKIDLSTVVSKYIGETEKNLSKVFEEAETSNGILFFDEADALFGKRSEVKDAHDRYANIEINYLLQRVEDFEGLVILATNLRKNIDEAFFRRMNFAVEFPLPDESNRYRIWKQHLPASAPVAGDVDFGFLARRLNITGGNIKNVVINAAFLAAANSGVIHMEHFVRAAKREYEKIGRLCTDAEFAPYQAWLKDS